MKQITTLGDFLRNSNGRHIDGVIILSYPVNSDNFGFKNKWL